jgi:DNA mismatch endonuclease (patch repair protein)
MKPEEKKKTYLREGRAPIPKKEVTSEVMSAIKAKNTKPELILRKTLYHNGFSGYRLHWKKAPGRPDICYFCKKIAIFVNGCYWHRCPYCNPPTPKTHTDFWENKFKKNVERDKRKIKELENDNWKVLTIWECQIKNDLQNCIERVQKVFDHI